MPEGKKTVTEGKATIVHQGENVFYNPAQVNSLSMSSLALEFLAQSVSILTILLSLCR